MQNSIKFLLAGFIVLVVVSWFVISGKKSTIAQEQFLIPELQSEINDIDKIEIKRNDKIINLSKAEGTWRIQQVNNFIADANKVANLLLDLRKFKLKEKKTFNPDNYAKLSLAESGTNAATVIKLYKGEIEIANVSIGKQAQKSQGTYVRKNDEVQTWLSHGKLSVKLDTNDWIVNTIFDVDVSQIKSVAFKSSDKESFAINKLSPQDTSFEITSMPDNHQLKTGLAINTLANGLQKFTIENIVDIQELPEKSVLTVTYELFSGLQYQLSFYQKEDKILMKVDFVNLGSNNQYEQQLSQWSYEIASYKFDALNKKLSDVVEVIPEAKKTTE